MSILSNYSKEEFEQIAKKSINFADFSRKLGYTTDSSKTRELIKKKIEEYNVDISHFNVRESSKRTVENIFIKNSTADQSTLRRWYKKGEYTPYKCSICGQEPLWKGKELTLILDHINGEHYDDRLENLRWVCPNCNQQLETTGSRNKIKKKYFCIDCGKEICNGATRCFECYNKTRIIPESAMLVTREELKNLIRVKPFTQIGRQFGVSDNAIRKWCDKYMLPRKSTEIKKYSDEDWAKI